MTESRVITQRDTMREAPPDILLTNYKMLDYLLLRPKDLRLWAAERAGDAAVSGGGRTAHVRWGRRGRTSHGLIRRLKERPEDSKAGTWWEWARRQPSAAMAAALGAPTGGLRGQGIRGAVLTRTVSLGESVQSPGRFPGRQPA